jgi:hypothetical protein
MIGEPALPCVAGLGLEPANEIDDVIEPATCAGSDAAAGGDDASGIAYVLLELGGRPEGGIPDYELMAASPLFARREEDGT